MLLGNFSRSTITTSNKILISEIVHIILLITENWFGDGNSLAFGFIRSTKNSVKIQNIKFNFIVNFKNYKNNELISLIISEFTTVNNN